MTIFPAKIGSSRLHHRQHTLVGGVVLAVIAMFAAPGWAAGCHDLAGSSAAQALDPFGNPLPENIVKTYSGGEFAYYVLPNGKPCDGPNCRSLPLTSMTSQPAATSSDRVDVTFLNHQVSAGQTFYAGKFWYWPPVTPASPVLDGLLRPPTI